MGKMAALSFNQINKSKKLSRNSQQSPEIKLKHLLQLRKESILFNSSLLCLSFKKLNLNKIWLSKLSQKVTKFILWATNQTRFTSFNQVKSTFSYQSLKSPLKHLPEENHLVDLPSNKTKREQQPWYANQNRWYC